jgi:hypothetical protein
VVARDGRFGYYAGATLILMPVAAVPDFCAWLQTHEDAEFVALDNHDERRLGITATPECLSLVKRYPRYGSAYYDLFEVRRSK